MSIKQKNCADVLLSFKRLCFNTNLLGIDVPTIGWNTNEKWKIKLKQKYEKKATNYAF